MIVHEETSNHDEKHSLAGKEIYTTKRQAPSDGKMNFKRVLGKKYRGNSEELFLEFALSQAAIFQEKRHPDYTI